MTYVDFIPFAESIINMFANEHINTEQLTAPEITRITRKIYELGIQHGIVTAENATTDNISDVRFLPHGANIELVKLGPDGPEEVSYENAPPEVQEIYKAIITNLGGALPD